MSPKACFKNLPAPFISCYPLLFPFLPKTTLLSLFYLLFLNLSTLLNPWSTHPLSAIFFIPLTTIFSPIYSSVSSGFWILEVSFLNPTLISWPGLALHSLSYNTTLLSVYLHKDSLLAQNISYSILDSGWSSDTIQTINFPSTPTSTLNMESECFSETLVSTYKSTWHHIPEQHSQKIRSIS